MADAAGGFALERSEPVQPLAIPMGAAKSLPSTMARIERHRGWPELSRLPMRSAVSVVVPHFRVQHLLALKPGQTVESVWPTGEDLPFTVGGAQLFWCEFELVEDKLAVRLTRLP